MINQIGKSEVFRLNYFVGAMLAQGGDLWFDDSKIFFSPTSSIDRAFGATDIEIPFNKIQNMEFKGDLTKFFHVKTADKLHRFHGSQAKRAGEALAKTLQSKGMQSIPQPDKKNKPCQKCSSHLEANFLFCPFCGVSVKTV